MFTIICVDWYICESKTQIWKINKLQIRLAGWCTAFFLKIKRKLWHPKRVLCCPLNVFVRLCLQPKFGCSKNLTHKPENYWARHSFGVTNLKYHENRTWFSENLLFLLSTKHSNTTKKNYKYISSSNLGPILVSSRKITIHGFLKVCFMLPQLRLIKLEYIFSIEKKPKLFLGKFC